MRNQNFTFFKFDYVLAYMQRNTCVCDKNGLRDIHLRQKAMTFWSLLQVDQQTVMNVQGNLLHCAFLIGKFRSIQIPSECRRRLLRPIPRNCLHELHKESSQKRSCAFVTSMKMYNFFWNTCKKLFMVKDSSIWNLFWRRTQILVTESSIAKHENLFVVCRPLCKS